MAKAPAADDLSEQAWELIKEAMSAGTMTLPGGKVYTLDPKDFVRLCQWLGTQKTKKPKIVANPDDFGLQRTET